MENPKLAVGGAGQGGEGAWRHEGEEEENILEVLQRESSSKCRN